MQLGELENTRTLSLYLYLEDYGRSDISVEAFSVMDEKVMCRIGSINDTRTIDSRWTKDMTHVVEGYDIGPERPLFQQLDNTETQQVSFQIKCFYH